MKLYKLIRDSLMHNEVQPLGENEFFVTDVVTCPIKKEIYGTSLDNIPALHGNAVHLAIQSILAKAGCVNEVSVSYKVPGTPYTLRGRVDSLCPDGTLVEIKTSSVVNPEHLVQLYIYMRALGTPEGYLVYLSTKVFDTYVFDGNTLCNEETEECVDVEEKYGIRIDDRLVRKLVEAYANGEKRPLLNQCHYCYFRDSCPFRIL